MTKEEVINKLNSLKQYYNDDYDDDEVYVGFDAEDNEAIDMAIKVLEQQPCEDCVSRKTIQKAIKDMLLWINSGNRGNTDYFIVDKVEEIINQLDIDSLPPVTPKSEWIPCSERLPEEKDYRACQENLDGAVLWCTERGMIGLGWYYESTKAWADIHDEEIEKRWGKIIAWMPLPEAYKAESEDEE